MSPRRSLVAGRLGQCHTEGLEHRLEHVVGVLALDQPHVQRQRGRVGERGEEACGEIGAEPARAGEVGVRGDEGRAGRLDGDHRERLDRDHHPVPVGPGSQQRRERLTDRGPGCIDLGHGLVRLDLEREVEAAGPGKLDQEMVEQRHPGRDVREAGSRCDPGAAHSSPRSISAPSARSRSSMRS